MKLIVLTAIPRKVVPIVFLLVLISSSVMAQETSKNTKFLLGTWELDYNQSIAQASGSGKAHYDTLSYERKSRIINSFSQRKMTFREGGTYILVVRAGIEVMGTWELQSDNESLNIFLDGRLIEQRIEQISESNLVLNLGGDQSGGLFSKWYLNKVGN